jgi:hypothetical protein
LAALRHGLAKSGRRAHAACQLSLANPALPGRATRRQFAARPHLKHGGKPLTCVYSPVRSLARAGAVLLCLSLSQLPAAAQGRGLAYIAAGPAGVAGWFGPRESFHVAGGGELKLGAAGAGGELAYWTSGLGMASVNGILSAPARSGRKTIPFLTAGYTKAFTLEQSFNAWNVGGGLNYWLRQAQGLRIEFRDHIRPDARGTLHYWSIRAGLVIR